MIVSFQQKKILNNLRTEMILPDVLPLGKKQIRIKGLSIGIIQEPLKKRKKADNILDLVHEIVALEKKKGG